MYSYVDCFFQAGVMEQEKLDSFCLEIAVLDGGVEINVSFYYFSQKHLTNDLRLIWQFHPYGNACYESGL